MEHYRSVFATAAAIVFGLVTASHVLYPRGTEDDRPVLRTSFLTNAAQAAPAAWTDPPQARNDLTIKAGATPTHDNRQSIHRPPTFTLLSADTVALLTANAAPADVAVRPGTTGKRRRMTRSAVRLRIADAAQTQPAQAVAATQNAAKASETAPRVNLIGDLLKNLGIGRES